jgi:hypothetical protein
VLRELGEKEENGLLQEAVHLDGDGYGGAGAADV